MKRIAILFVLAVASLSASAGVLKFSAKHIVKPAAKASAKVAKDRRSRSSEDSQGREGSYLVGVFLGLPPSLPFSADLGLGMPLLALPPLRPRATA